MSTEYPHQCHVDARETCIALSDIPLLSYTCVLKGDTMHKHYKADTGRSYVCDITKVTSRNCAMVSEMLRKVKVHDKQVNKTRDNTTSPLSTYDKYGVTPYRSKLYRCLNRF